MNIDSELNKLFIKESLKFINKSREVEAGIGLPRVIDLDNLRKLALKKEASAREIAGVLKNITVDTTLLYKCARCSNKIEIQGKSLHVKRRKAIRRVMQGNTVFICNRH
jgi:hypothetical protein